MKNYLLTLAACIALLTFAMTQAHAVVEASQLVLVVGEEATTQPFTPAQLRKLFLGLAKKHEGNAIHPLRNMSDEKLYNVFLQKVVFMSARNYERHLLSRVINMGGQRPFSYMSQTELLRSLRSDPYSVSYMWENTVRETPGVKILQKLW